MHKFLVSNCCLHNGKRTLISSPMNFVKLYADLITTYDISATATTAVKMYCVVGILLSTCSYYISLNLLEFMGKFERKNVPVYIKLAIFSFFKRGKNLLECCVSYVLSDIIIYFFPFTSPE